MAHKTNKNWSQLFKIDAKKKDKCDHDPSQCHKHKHPINFVSDELFNLCPKHYKNRTQKLFSDDTFVGYKNQFTTNHQHKRCKDDLFIKNNVFDDFSTEDSEHSEKDNNDWFDEKSIKKPVTNNKNQCDNSNTETSISPIRSQKEK